ncbi:MAG: DUF2158 domain-containing protein [Agitococcus sp.]|nr:DUF2158 domain-containing protein [Agitococcus sp.]MDO9179090.1 DUF2158 domain-containing protein [Agitococcus sp.]
MAIAIKLVVGNVVRLISDGPWMTVTKDRPEAGAKFVEVSWFEGAILHREILPKDALLPSPETLAAAKAKEAKPAE